MSGGSADTKRSLTPARQPKRPHTDPRPDSIRHRAGAHRRGRPLGRVEAVTLADAAGRVLAEEVRAAITDARFAFAHTAAVGVRPDAAALAVAQAE